jgi:hypothetical protein
VADARPRNDTEASAFSLSVSATLCALSQMVTVAALVLDDGMDEALSAVACPRLETELIPWKSCATAGAGCGPVHMVLLLTIRGSGGVLLLTIRAGGGGTSRAAKRTSATKTSDAATRADFPMVTPFFII